MAVISFSWWKCWIIMAKLVEIKEKNRYNVKETGKYRIIPDY